MARRRRRVSHYPLFDGPCVGASSASGVGAAGECPGAETQTAGASADPAVEPFIVATAPLPAAALAQLQQGARIAAAILWTCQHPERFPGSEAPGGE